MSLIDASHSTVVAFSRSDFCACRRARSTLVSARARLPRYRAWMSVAATR